MKTEDFERLKAKLGDEFEVIRHWDIMIVVVDTKKDPWDGVEFARHKFPNAGQFACFKIKSISEQLLTTEGGAELFKGNCDPITESAYIEQLKNECFKKFGEIKEGDRFQTDFGLDSAKAAYPEFHYNKNIDHFSVFGVIVYSNGKWATRVKERVEVEYGHYSLPFDPEYILALHFSIDDPNRMNDDAGKFLASQLEKYLNNEL